MEENLNAKLSKCEFCIDCEASLGHVVTKEGIELDPTKTEVVWDWTIPPTYISN